MVQKQSKVSRLVFTALLAALVFASNYISFPIGQSRIHIANAVCLLSGMILGPLSGGIAAGLGSALFDLTFPAYAAEWWITFINKAAMAAVCGWLVHKRDTTNKSWVYFSCFIGAITYIALYLFKSFLQLRFITQVPIDTIAPTLLTYFLASIANGLFAILAAPVVFYALNPTLDKMGISFKKYDKQSR
ncbi:MAG: ECF transporter S component [Eubacteriales bacterium]|nr:ECF transporter S component [Eubacteriales bacterium]